MLETCPCIVLFLLAKGEVIMADINLKKLSRAELLEMMIGFSEEAEEARRREEELKENMEWERIQMQQQMASEREAMLKSFDEEKAEMRQKFNEQKAELQKSFEKDIEGLKARHKREMQAKDEEVKKKLNAIAESGSLAEASIKLGGIFEAAQKAADTYVEAMKARAAEESKQDE